MHPLDIMLRKLSGQVALTNAESDAIRALPATVRTLEPSAYIVREGEAPDRSGFMVSGFAFRHRLLEDGSRQIVGLHVPGDPLDFQCLFLDVADHNLQAMSRAEIAFVPRDRLRHLVGTNRGVAHAAEVNFAIDGSILREWIVNVGRRDAPTRLAHLLCELAVRLAAVGLADDLAFALPMTQEQLGDALGLTAVHVNRTLRTLELRGLVARERRFIIIRDWNGLRNLSGFNARYLHVEREPARPFLVTA